MALGSLQPPRADVIQHICLEGLKALSERLVVSGGWVEGFMGILRVYG